MICWGERTEMPYANHDTEDVTSKSHVDGAIPAAVRTLKRRVVCVEELTTEATAAVPPAIWAQSGITASF